MGLVALGATAMFACADARSSDHETSSASNDIVVGVDAQGRTLDAVGAIVAVMDPSTPEPAAIPYCNGTLIAPRLVLTSKGCVERTLDSDSDAGAATQDLFQTYPLFFFTGADLHDPSHKVRIEGVDLCTGCDAAVFRLQEPIADIAPLPFTDQAMGAERLGQRFSTAGYGETSTTRRAGTLTLRAVSGAPLEAWLDADDAQTCVDPGAPLLAKDAEEKLTVFGVASRCLRLDASYAMLGDAVQSLIARNLVDPCGSETTLGRCDGDVAVRCTTSSEGPRRITRSDCAAVFQHCAPPSEAHAQVACAD